MCLEMNPQVVLVRQKFRANEAFCEKLWVWDFRCWTGVGCRYSSTRYGSLLRGIVWEIQQIFHHRRFHHILVIEISLSRLQRVGWHWIRCRWRFFLDNRHLTEVIEETFRWTWRGWTWRWCRTSESKIFGNFVDFSEIRRLHSLLLVHSIFLVKFIDEISALLFKAIGAVWAFIELRWLRW